MQLKASMCSKSANAQNWLAEGILVKHQRNVFSQWKISIFYVPKIAIEIGKFLGLAKPFKHKFKWKLPKYNNKKWSEQFTKRQNILEMKRNEWLDGLGNCLAVFFFYFYVWPDHFVHVQKFSMKLEQKNHIISTNQIILNARKVDNLLIYY